MTKIVLPNNGWEPRDYQIEAWNAMVGPEEQRCKTGVLAWCRRAGKDDISGHALAIRAMERVGNYWHCLVKHEQARRAIWEGVNPRTGRQRWQDWFPPSMIKHVDNQSMRLTFVNGSTYQLMGSDNVQGMVGAAPVGIVYSEAALADPTAFALLRPIIAENDGFSWYISSVRGRNHFYRIYQAALQSPTGFAQHLSAEHTGIFTPDQLEEERREYISIYGAAYGLSLFEQEYLSSWDSAVVGAVFGTEIKELKDSGRAHLFDYDPRYPVYTSWDIGIGDPTYILFWQIIGNRPRLIDWYSGTDAGLDAYAEVLAEKPYFYAKHLGPHDITHRGGGHGASWYDVGRTLGIYFERVPTPSKREMLAAGSQVIRRMEINANHEVEPEDPFENCYHILEALTLYRFKFDSERRVMSPQPIHDWTSHPSDALMTFAAWFMGQRDFTGRATPVQGRAIEEDAEFRHTRVRDIMRSKTRSVKGAFG